ncbi:MAG: DUF4007 family protein [Desulfobacteraceae bacterium]|nr:DUF4007 family protein [Desulfobacteraceae bacterium]
MTEKGKTEHRQRLRDRFLAGDAKSCSDEMLLELLLTFAVRRKDVMPLVQELIQIFGSLSQILSASYDELCKVKGIGHASVTLLKAVYFIQSGTATKTPSLPKGTGTQQKLFENLPDEPISSLNKKQAKSSENQLTVKKSTRRKFQVSNGYLLKFDQLARILNFLLENRNAKKINRKALQDDTGLADRQVGALVSMGSAMGLVRPGLQILTPVGLLITEHDIFMEKKGTLEWCHYAGAGAARNLIWFEIFNHLLVETAVMTQNEWNGYLRNRFSGQYSNSTIRRHVPGEVRFLVDAYMQGNFSKLELLHKSPDEQLYLRRYTRFAPLVLSAIIYDFCAANETHLYQVGEMAVTPGSPAVVFGLDAALFRQQIEGLHDRGWLRYETTHNLDQIRLKPGFSVLEFLTAYFEDREPCQGELGMMNDE